MSRKVEAGQQPENCRPHSRRPSPIEIMRCVWLFSRAFREREPMTSDPPFLEKRHPSRTAIAYTAIGSVIGNAGAFDPIVSF